MGYSVMNRFVGALRSCQCRVIQGASGYNGAITLAFLFAAVAATNANAQEFQEVHDCDQHAAHPSDPHRWAGGVKDNEIIPGPAVTFCRRAVDEHPQTPRFAFQLGRALWAANRIDEGTELFLALTEQFAYGPAYYYLAHVFVSGLGSVEADEERGKALYQTAAEKGFAPASQALRALAEANDTTRVDTLAASSGTTAPSAPIERLSAPRSAVDHQDISFEPDQYTQPSMVRALYSGDLAGLEPQGVGQTNYAGLSSAHIYLASFHNQFGGTVNLQDQSCVTLYDPSVTRTLDAKVARLITGGPGLDLESSLDQAGRRGWEMMGDLLMDLHRGGLDALVSTEQNLLELGEQGGIDAARLIARHGCQSEVAKRIYANIRAYALGQPPVLSPQEQERQQSILNREAEEAERERQQSLRTDAAASCFSQWQEEPMCQCIVAALDHLKITEGEWRMIGNEFTSVVSLVRRYEGLREDLGSCRS